MFTAREFCFAARQKQIPAKFARDNVFDRRRRTDYHRNNSFRR
jgi:hypothetical protein